MSFTGDVPGAPLEHGSSKGRPMDPQIFEVIFKSIKIRLTFMIVVIIITGLPWWLRE